MKSSCCAAEVKVFVMAPSSLRTKTLFSSNNLYKNNSYRNHYRYLLKLNKSLKKVFSEWKSLENIEILESLFSGKHFWANRTKIFENTCLKRDKCLNWELYYSFERCKFLVDFFVIKIANAMILRKLRS